MGLNPIGAVTRSLKGHIIDLKGRGLDQKEALALACGLVVCEVLQKCHDHISIDLECHNKLWMSDFNE